MRKFSWIVALLIALSLAFIGCPTDGGGGGKGPPTPPSLPPLEITGSDIVLTAITAGDKTSDVTITGNKFKMEGVTGATYHGFYYEFPADLEAGYTEINVEMEIISLTSPNFISFNAKATKTLGTDVNIISKVTGEQLTKQYRNELKIGELEEDEDGELLEYVADSCKVGAKNDESYPFGSFNGFIAFQFNPWAGDITPATEAANVNADFEIAVTKITFKSSNFVAPPPPPPITGDYEVPTGGIDLGPITADDNPYWEVATADVTSKPYLYVVFSQAPNGGGNFVWQDSSDPESGYNGWHNAGQGIFDDNGALDKPLLAEFTDDAKILKIDMAAVFGTDTPATYLKLVFQYYGGGGIIGAYLLDE